MLPAMLTRESTKYSCLLFEDSAPDDMIGRHWVASRTIFPLNLYPCHRPYLLMTFSTRVVALLPTRWWLYHPRTLTNHNPITVYQVSLESHPAFAAMTEDPSIQKLRYSAPLVARVLDLKWLGTEPIHLKNGLDVNLHNSNPTTEVRPQASCFRDCHMIYPLRCFKLV